MDENWYMGANTNSSGTASGLDHSWPAQIEHLRPELNAYFLAIYANYPMISHEWSIHPAYALYSGLGCTLYSGILRENNIL